MNPTVEYSFIEESVKHELGQSTLSLDESMALANYLTKNAKTLWREYEWPFITRYGEQRTASNKIIPLAESGLDDIGEVFHVFSESPFDGSARPSIPFALRTEDIYVPSLSTDATCAYVTYRTRPPSFRGREYSVSTSYSLGNVVYGNTTATDGTTQKDYYKSLVNSNVGNALTETNKWEKIKIPEQFSEILSRMCFADMCKAAGEYTIYVRASEEAKMMINQQIYVVEEQENQGVRTSFTTHYTTQSRNRNAN